MTPSVKSFLTLDLYNLHYPVYATDMIDFFKKVAKFIKDVSEDERIPSRDKKVLIALLALVISPFDLIPDWIPIIGLLDDFVIIALILHYLFEHLDQNILLSHYPWGMKSYTFIRRSCKVIASFAPNSLKNRIWKYEPPKY